jgi:hypothetical protein
VGLTPVGEVMGCVVLQFGYQVYGCGGHGYAPSAR